VYCTIHGYSACSCNDPAFDLGPRRTIFSPDLGTVGAVIEPLPDLKPIDINLRTSFYAGDNPVLDRPLVNTRLDAFNNVCELGGNPTGLQMNQLGVLEPTPSLPTFGGGCGTGGGGFDGGGFGGGGFGGGGCGGGF